MLVVSQMVNVAFGPVGLALTLSGFERHAFTGQLAGLLVSVSITVLLVGRWGDVGAAVGAFGGLLVWNIWMAYQVRRHWEGPFLFLERSGTGQMIISDRNKFVFIHIPKCAGTSIRSRVEHLDDRNGAYSSRLDEHPELGLLN